MILAIFLTGAPAWAQNKVGRVANSANGQTGQRQTRDQAVAAGIQVTSRINSRIQSRVQSRIANRIDQYYNPQVDAAASTVAAADRLRTAGRSRR